MRLGRSQSWQRTIASDNQGYQPSPRAQHRSIWKPMPETGLEEGAPCPLGGPGKVDVEVVVNPFSTVSSLSSFRIPLGSSSTALALPRIGEASTRAVPAARHGEDTSR